LRSTRKRSKAESWKLEAGSWKLFMIVYGVNPVMEALRAAAPGAPDWAALGPSRRKALALASAGVPVSVLMPPRSTASPARCLGLAADLDAPQDLGVVDLVGRCLIRRS
jgi:hypothetical protein